MAAEHGGAGKRPFHTLIPGSVSIPGSSKSADGSGDTPYVGFGLMGGAMQAQGHAQFLLNMFVFGMNVQEAMDAARFRHFSGQSVAIEAAAPDSVEKLRMGQQSNEVGQSFCLCG